MFTGFFYYLRANGSNVGVQEWLTLCEALDKGMAQASFTQFYMLCRAILVKSETEYDRFDINFTNYFKEIATQSDSIPQDLLDWLNKPLTRHDNYVEEVAQLNLSYSFEEIERMLKERIEEQNSQHNGGNYWVGTGGMSTFGNSGNSPVGIRVGGKSMFHRAFRVAGERRFRDFTEDKALDTRQFQVALRRLRQYSVRTDAPKTELNVDATAKATGDNGGMLKLVYERPRRNTVKVLMLMDSGGSMEYYARMCTALFQAVRKSNHFSDLKIYYFHNCIYGKVFTTPVCDPRKSITVESMLKTLGHDYRVIFVGDGEMAPFELFNNRYFQGECASGLQWLQKIRDWFGHVVWLNPSAGDSYFGDNQTYETIRSEFDMYYLTVKNLERALKKLVAAK